MDVMKRYGRISLAELTEGTERNTFSSASLREMPRLAEQAFFEAAPHGFEEILSGLCELSERQVRQDFSHRAHRERGDGQTLCPLRTLRETNSGRFWSLRSLLEAM